MISHLQPAMTPAQLLELQRAVPQMLVSDALLDYVQAHHQPHAPLAALHAGPVARAPASRSCAPPRRGR